MFGMAKINQRRNNPNGSSRAQASAKTFRRRQSSRFVGFGAGGKMLFSHVTLSSIIK